MGESGRMSEICYYCMMDIAPLIEHTLLRPDCCSQDILRLCEEASHYRFRGVCVPPYFVLHAKKMLENDQNVKVVTVIGFPFGYSVTQAKVAEIQQAVADGADEVDVVINGCAVSDGRWVDVRNDLDQMTRVVREADKLIKVIIEGALLSEGKLLNCCDVCSDSGVDFVKTSTGFFGGASIQMVRTMRKRLPNSIRIKASGGIRDRATALALVEAGADSIGTSSGPQLVQIV